VSRSDKDWVERLVDAVFALIGALVTLLIMVLIVFIIWLFLHVPWGDFFWAMSQQQLVVCCVGK
jgi:lipopolysaccharide/colanic/teichoic acid biosynthesis glycosyltransferase